MQRPHLEYRREIDGLRAFAVLPIVLFHAGVEGLAGGFVGVDIFFVISGFLITSIVFSDMRAGTFTLGEFYVRRIVRIFPALFAMLIIVALVSFLILFPSERKPLLISAAAAATFISNIYFWREVDYFLPAAETQALLHTWSLGVEEQFYIFYPILLLLAARRGVRAVVGVVLVLTLASFCISLALDLVGKGKTAFYLLPSRTWELGFGALIALGAYPRFSRKPWLREMLALLGLIGILAAVVFVRSSPGFPAPWALLPCLGAGLVLAYGRETRVAALLSLGPIAWIGWISYSLYLWHWPIIVLYRMMFGAALEPTETVGLVALSILAAVLSFILIERPCLRTFRMSSTRPVLLAGLGGAAVIAVTGLGLGATAYSLRSYEPRIATLLSMGDYRTTKDYKAQFRPEFCFIEPSSSTPVDSSCMALSDAKPNMVVVGDSFAAHYWRAFADRFAGYNVLQATAPGCRPTLFAVGTEACLLLVNRVLGAMADSGKLEVAVLAGRWIEADVGKLAPTIRHLSFKGVRVLVVGPSVEYRVPVPELLARTAVAGKEYLVSEAIDHRRKRLSDAMKEIVIEAGGAFAAPYDLDCAQSECRSPLENGTPAYFDCCHLTLEKSRALVWQFPEP